MTWQFVTEESSLSLDYLCLWVSSSLPRNLVRQTGTSRFSWTRSFNRPRIPTAEGTPCLLRYDRYAVQFKLNVRLKHSDRVSETEEEMKTEMCVHHQCRLIIGCFNLGVKYSFSFQSDAEILTRTFRMSKSQLPQSSHERRTA